jgi:hypothetical protein
MPDIRHEAFAHLTSVLMDSCRPRADVCPRPDEQQVRTAISLAVQGLTTQCGEALEQLSRAEYDVSGPRLRLERLHHARRLVEDMLQRIKDAEAVVARAAT